METLLLPRLFVKTGVNPPPVGGQPLAVYSLASLRHEYGKLAAGAARQPRTTFPPPLAARPSPDAPSTRSPAHAVPASLPVLRSPWPTVRKPSQSLLPAKPEQTSALLPVLPVLRCHLTRTARTDKKPKAPQEEEARAGQRAARERQAGSAVSGAC